MAKIEITKTELVWPGKYNEDGTLKEALRVSLPFQYNPRPQADLTLFCNTWLRNIAEQQGVCK